MIEQIRREKNDRWIQDIEHLNKLDYMDFSEEELTRIIACAMKHRDIKNMVNTVFSERKSATTENVKNEGAGDDEGNGEN